MSRGYGKYRRQNSHTTSIAFEKLLKENSNCPSAARSTGTIGKWGITSFTTTTRTVNGKCICFQRLKDSGVLYKRSYLLSFRCPIYASNMAEREM